MNIHEATSGFEKWLGKYIEIVPSDLAYKHEQMKADPFLFFRATYYRWCQLFREECPKLLRAAQTSAVGDLHLENFGTWRDAEGRLVWGVNDFDEAYPMTFANDLVRLAVSTFLAAKTNKAFVFERAEICDLILQGYRAYLEKGGEPYVLMEDHPHLRQMALQALRAPVEFWNRMREKTEPLALKKIPKSIQAAIHAISPAVEFDFRDLGTPKGLGSLGRQRFLAIGEWQGAMIAREAKAVAPSALLWAEGRKPTKGNFSLDRTVRAAVRCEDPYYQVQKGWLVRRLAPDCGRIDMNELRHHDDHALLLTCMGGETANIHLGSKKARRRIVDDLDKLPRKWLFHAAQKLLRRSLRDWKRFNKT